MSIILAAAPTTSPLTENIPPALQFALALLILIGLPLSILIIRRLKLLHLPFLPSPSRLAPGESPFILLVIFLSGFAILLVFTSLFYRFFSDQSPTPRAIIAMAFAEVIAIIGMTLVNALLRRDGPQLLGFTPASLPHAIASALLGFLLIIPWVLIVNALLESILSYFKVEFPTQHEIFQLWSAQGPGPSLFKVMAILTATLIAPFAEEFAFRGLLQTFFRRVLRSPWLAILLTSFLFTYIHQPWSIRPAIFILALGLGLAYERTNNLWVPILIHIIFNSTQFALFLFTVSSRQ